MIYEIFLLSLFAVGGSLANRIRGGGGFEEINTGFFIFFWFAVSWATLESGLGTQHWDIPNYLTAFLFVLGIYIGETFGWGRYFGAMKDDVETKFKTIDRYDEVVFIDWFIKELIPTKDDCLTLRIFKTRLWGFIGMTLRGLVWMLLPAIALCSAIPLLVGLTMGVVYYTSRNVKYHWEQSEYIFGFLMGIGFYYAL